MQFLSYTEVGLLVYFTLSIIWSYMLMFGAWRMLRKPDTVTVTDAPLVSILIPAYNEEDVILESVRQAMRNNYSNLEICICDDASTDETSDLLIADFDLKQETEDSRIWHDDSGRIKLFRAVKNRGRAGALNMALTLATGKYVVQTDADTFIDINGLDKMVRLAELGGHGAVGGTLLLANEIKMHPGGYDWYAQISKKWLAGTQAVEYLRAFLYGRLGLNKLGGNVIVSGAFGLFRADITRELGGWNEKSVAEDFDLTTRVRQAGGTVRFIPDPVAYTQAPPDVRSLGHQRSRWHRGLTEIFFRGPGRANMFKNGWLGKWVLPVHFFVEWLAPIMEAIGLVLVTLHLVRGDHLILLAPLMVIGYLLNVLLSLISIKFEQDNFNRYAGSYNRAIKYALLEPFWYRPLTIFWRLRGMFEYMTGKKGWGGLIKRESFGVLAALVLMVTPADAATRLELTHSSEAGQVVERYDTTLSFTHQAASIYVMNRSREDDSDREFGFSLARSLNEQFDYRIGIHTAEFGDILPTWGWTAGGSLVNGAMVFNVDVKRQFFDPDFDVTLLFFRTDYYWQNYRFAFQAMTSDKADVHAGTIYVQWTGDEVDWMLYASSGNEILDIPLQIGSNEVVGGVFRPNITENVRLMIGANVGQRADRRYSTFTVGIRRDF